MEQNLNYRPLLLSAQFHQLRQPEGKLFSDFDRSGRPELACTG
jgi:hypothetical protein